MARRDAAPAYPGAASVAITTIPKEQASAVLLTGHAIHVLWPPDLRDRYEQVVRSSGNLEDELSLDGRGKLLDTLHCHDERAGAADDAILEIEVESRRCCTGPRPTASAS